jgi:exopolysaccharide production protein ExoZ
MLFTTTYGNSKMQNLKTIVSIQYLRALAALAVVVFHAATRTDLSFTVGQAGVDLFFVISGFLMVSITGPTTQPLSFMRDRIVRIVPLYWLATTLLIVVALLGFAPKLSLEIDYIVKSYFFVPAYMPNSSEIWPVLVPGWTLNYEIFFYVLFASIILIFKNKYRFIALAVILSFFVGIGMIFQLKSAIFATYTNPILLDFVFGALVATISQRIIKLPQYLGHILIAVSFAMLTTFEAIFPSSSRFLKYGAPAAILLIGVLMLDMQMPTSIALRAFKFLGDASYSIYLWHPLAISLTTKIAKNFALTATFEILLGLVVGTCVGIMSYLAIEKPMMSASKAMLRKKVG